MEFQSLFFGKNIILFSAEFAQRVVKVNFLTISLLFPNLRTLRKVSIVLFGNHFHSFMNSASMG